MLKGKTALITGASRGIGKAIAEAFLRQQAQCILVSRSPEGAFPWDTIGTEAVIARANVADPRDWSALQKKHQDIDILVHAAGLAQTSLFHQTSQTEIDALVSTNFLGPMIGSRVFAKSLIRRKGGLIFVSSIASSRPPRGSSVYAATKAAVEGLCRALANELGPLGVRANCIAPGYIDTDMTSGLDPGLKTNITSRTPLRRFGKAEDIAQAALFLATSACTTGTVLTVDGGLSSSM